MGKETASKDNSQMATVVNAMRQSSDDENDEVAWPIQATGRRLHPTTTHVTVSVQAFKTVSKPKTGSHDQ